MPFHLEIKSDPETGLLLADIDPENSLLKGFLETEIQQDIILLDDLLDRLGQAPAPHIDLNGNAYNLNTSDGKYIISSLFEDLEETTGPLSEFLSLLQQWRNFFSF